MFQYIDSVRIYFDRIVTIGVIVSIIECHLLSYVICQAFQTIVIVIGWASVVFIVGLHFFIVHVGFLSQDTKTFI